MVLPKFGLWLAFPAGVFVFLGEGRDAWARKTGDDGTRTPDAYGSIEAKCQAVAKSGVHYLMETAGIVGGLSW